MKWDILTCAVLGDMTMLYYLRNDIGNRKLVLEKYLESARRTSHKGLIRHAEEMREFYEEKGPFITGPADIPRSTEDDFEKLTDEEIDRMHRKLLEAGGIDINGDDDLSELARLGLRDRNPERILKHCEHLHVEIVNYGPIWKMVGLRTTGTKILYCEERECYLTGGSLDRIIDEFRQKYCSGCDFHWSRPADWKWTYRWQKERKQPQEMKLILQRLREIG
jgi:hypothetical protein